MEWPEHHDLKHFTYERGEGRTKHCWNRDEAGFLPSKRGQVGKCHNSITDDLAQTLLRTGIPEPSLYEDDLVDGPDAIYNVYRGVPYKAVTTLAGRSYHGYPWRGRMPGSIREELRKRAAKEGTQEIFERWLKKHSEP